jgi:serine/threonine protein kinase
MQSTSDNKTSEQPSNELRDGFDDIPRIKRSNLQDTIINKRYVIGHMIGRGAFSHVYKVYDKQNKDLPLAIKFSKDYNHLDKEINTVAQIQKHI